jgi:hypothetical protein
MVQDHWKARLTGGFRIAFRPVSGNLYGKFRI